jgi:hypothetical protein
MLPGGSLGLRYILQLLLSEKLKNGSNSTTIDTGEKISTDLESSDMEIFLALVSLNSKTIKFYSIKLATGLSKKQAIY